MISFQALCHFLSITSLRGHRPKFACISHISANTQPCTELSSQSQPPELSVPEPNTCPENPEHGTTSPHNSAPHISDPDPIPRCDLQDDTSIPIEPPAFRGDIPENDLLSPSISSSDDSLEESFRLRDTQNDIPIDPVILANHWPWRMAISSNLTHKPTASSIQR